MDAALLQSDVFQDRLRQLLLSLPVKWSSSLWHDSSAMDQEAIRRLIACGFVDCRFDVEIRGKLPNGEWSAPQHFLFAGTGSKIFNEARQQSLTASRFVTDGRCNCEVAIVFSAHAMDLRLSSEGELARSDLQTKPNIIHVLAYLKHGTAASDVKRLAHESFVSDAATDGPAVADCAVPPADQPRRRITIEEADSKAHEIYSDLKRINNATEWGRRIGCDPRTAKALPTWQKAKQWRTRRDTISRTVKPYLNLSAADTDRLASGDPSVLDQLASDEERTALRKMDHNDMAELLTLIAQQNADDAT